MIFCLAAWTLCVLGSAVPAEGRWVAAWGSALHGTYPQAPKGLPFGEPSPALDNFHARNQTFRMIVRPTIDGTGVRVVISNLFGRFPLHIGHATVATTAGGAGIRDVGDLAFNGTRAVGIAPGADVTSDPLLRPVQGGQDLAVSLHVLGDSPLLSWHSQGYKTSYLTDLDSGDLTGVTNPEPFNHPTNGVFLVRRVDVNADAPSGVVVAFGDSITDGEGSTLNLNDRWADILAARLAARAPTGRYAVVNSGIGGNALFGTPCDLCAGVAAKDRIGRDVLSNPGVTDVIVGFGTNDILARRSAEQVIGALQDLVARLRANRLRVIGATIIPQDGDAVFNATRDRVNDWIRTRGHFDAVADFDAAVRDPAGPARFRPGYGVGDGAHPNGVGQMAMADSVNLQLFPEPTLSFSKRAAGAGTAIRMGATCRGRSEARCRARLRFTAGGVRFLRNLDLPTGSHIYMVRGTSLRKAKSIRVAILPAALKAGRTLRVVRRSARRAAR